MVAEIQLRLKGRDDLADRIDEEYHRKFKEYLTRNFMLTDIGDHKPLSDWLAGVTEILRLILGDFLMEQTHLSDIRILNYAIPVVFDPCNDDWDKKDYRQHFVPFSGVLAYWGVWTACKVAGGWPIPLACSAAGSLGKSIMVYVFSPSLSNLVYSQCE